MSLYYTGFPYKNKAILNCKGLGRFIVGYLYWQASLAGLRTRSTISRHNVASLRAHQAVADFAVIAELPHDYLLIEFLRVGRNRPVLGL